jgi:hypothetical protein
MKGTSAFNQQKLIVTLKLFFTLLATVCFTSNILIYSNEISKGGSPFKTGDWLINYSGGFVRRGFAGQVAIFISTVSGIDILNLVFFGQVFLFLFYILTILFLVFKTKSNQYLYAILFSPTFLLFYLLDPQASFRKEIIGYCLLTFTIFFGKMFKGTGTNLVIINLIYVMLLFSWELGFVFLLPLIYILRPKYILFKKKTVYSVLYFLPFATTLFAMPFLYLFKGNSKKVLQNCDSLIELGLKRQICDGAIAGLNLSPAAIWNQLNLLFKYDHYFLYLLPFLIVVFPIVLAFRKNNDFLGLASILPCISFFFIGYDYGRWINIMVTISVCMLLNLEYHNEKKNDEITINLFFFLYVFSSLFWGLHHYGYPFTTSLCDAAKFCH